MLWWLIWHSVSQTYTFWQHGIEKQAMVVAFDRTGTIIKGGIVFHYVLRIDNHTVVKGFLNQLHVGYTIPVVVISDSPSEDDVMMGTKSDGFVSMFSSVVGGRMTAAVLVFLIVPCLAFSTCLLPTLLKKTWGIEKTSLRRY